MLPQLTKSDAENSIFLTFLAPEKGEKEL